MHRCPSSFLGLLAAIAAIVPDNVPAQAPAAAAWIIEMRSDRHSDGVPLADLGADDPLVRLRARAGRNLAWIDDEVRLSRRDGDWTWSVLGRQYAMLSTGRDTLVLALQASGRGAARTDQRWQNRVRYQQFSGGGIELGRNLALDERWSGRLAVQGLVLQHWRTRKLDGPVGWEAATGTYRFDLVSQETDDRMAQPFQQPFDRRGAALLLQGDVAWRGEAWRLGLEVRDLGWLHWHGLPRQDLALSTETQAVDADGFVIYRPLVQGRDSQAGTTRALGGRWTARAAWQSGPLQRFEASLQTQAGFGVLPGFAWQRRVGSAQWSARWRFHDSRLTLGLDWQGLGIRLGADRLGAEAHSRELALSYSLAW